MNAPLAQKRDALLAELSGLSEEFIWQWLLDRARQLPALPADQCTDERRVPGCLSNLWLQPTFEDGRCQYRCAADSFVVQAITALLCDFYSGATPEEILALDPSFLRAAGITAHLTSHRRNAVTRVWALIRDFAARHAKGA